ncbi:MAG: hypothetical protein V2I63_01940 [Pseudomonadales bacterium]|jgi:hypothetical protein|nr:hypothetical protein [Pseudomonadales bacterium]
MRSAGHLSAFTGVLVLGLLASCAAPAPKQDPTQGYAEALDAALANAEDPRAQLFLLDLAPHVGLLMSTAPARYMPCFELAAGTPIELVARLDVDGQVLETRLASATEGNRCFARQLRQEVLPHPPATDWWTRIYLEGREEPGF